MWRSWEGLVCTAGSTGFGPYSPLVAGFRHAVRGVWVARSGTNFRIHLTAAATALVVAAAYGLRRTHLALVVLAIVAVLAAELLNTAIERICDLIAQVNGLGWDERIRDIKDLSAGAVLVICAGAAVVGAIVFVE